MKKKNVWRVLKKQRCIQNPCKHIRWSFSVNILNGFIFLQCKLPIIDLRPGYIWASENIEIFKVKLQRSKSSRLLQRIAFLVSRNFVTFSTEMILLINFTVFQLKYMNHNKDNFVCPLQTLIIKPEHMKSMSFITLQKQRFRWVQYEFVFKNYFHRIFSIFTIKFISCDLISCKNINPLHDRVEACNLENLNYFPCFQLVAFQNCCFAFV